MTGTEKQTVLTQVRELARDLFSALENDDYGTAGGLAKAIETLGIQALDRLMPRGTLEFPAGDRWGYSLTSELLEQLRHELPEAVTAQLLSILAYWGGQEAVPAIRQLLIERARRPHSVETARTVWNGLHALHMIGGSRAAQTLQDLQGTDLPTEIRSRAAWFLNELGGRIEDPMFGSQRRLESAQEVLRRDSLEDPYCWRPAAVRLRDYLGLVGHECLSEHPNAPRSVLSAKEADAICAAFSYSSSAAMRDGLVLNELEPVVPKFMIKLAPTEVLALDSVVGFFPSSDIEGLTELRYLKDWSRLGLVPDTMSASNLDQLSLFDAGDRDVTDDSDVRALFRDWLSVPLHLARLFGRRRQLPRVFSMAAFTYDMRRTLGFARDEPFAEILRTMFRGGLNPES
jgi:hypothetical protein